MSPRTCHSPEVRVYHLHSLVRRRWRRRGRIALLPSLRTGPRARLFTWHHPIHHPSPIHPFTHSPIHQTKLLPHLLHSYFDFYSLSEHSLSSILLSYLIAAGRHGDDALNGVYRQLNRSIAQSGGNHTALLLHARQSRTAPGYQLFPTVGSITTFCSMSVCIRFEVIQDGPIPNHPCKEVASSLPPGI